VPIDSKRRVSTNACPLDRPLTKSGAGRLTEARVTRSFISTSFSDSSTALPRGARGTRSCRRYLLKSMIETQERAGTRTYARYCLACSSFPAWHFQWANSSCAPGLNLAGHQAGLRTIISATSSHHAI
jgi:hypothetical protein